MPKTMRGKPAKPCSAGSATDPEMQREIERYIRAALRYQQDTEIVVRRAVAQHVSREQQAIIDRRSRELAEELAKIHGPARFLVEFMLLFYLSKAMH